MMKAYVLHGINDLCLEEVTKPIPQKGEVLVQVRAVGICGSDIPRIYRTGAHVHPLIPGHEFSGDVKEVGTGVDRSWIGKRVGIFPLIPCGKCEPCKQKKYEMCRNYNYLGSRCNGGFAEYVSVPVENLIELPENVSYEEAAMLEPMSVAVHAMRQVLSDIHTEKTILVCGLGTIGLFLVMFLRDAGMKNVLVIGNKEFQRRNVMKLGIQEEHYCDSRIQAVDKWIADCTDGMGVDIFFECVGKNETLMQAIDNTAPAGHICLVGNPYSDMGLGKSSYWKILRNQLTVKGTWNSSFTGDVNDDWHYVIDRLKSEKISPEDLISHKFSMDTLEQGLHIMRDKSEDYIKIMTVM